MSSEKKSVFELDFSHKKFIEIIQISNAQENTYDNDMYKRVNELNRIMHKDHSIPEDYSIYENFTRDEIEWFTDALMYWPYDDETEEKSLTHILVQQHMIEDMMKFISTGKKARKKGFVFI